MPFLFILFLLTFLAFPILGILIAYYLQEEKSQKYLKFIGWFFLVHNALFLLGFSIKGDIPDYVIFSLEYLYFSLVVAFLYKSKRELLRIFRILGTIVLIIGFLQVFLGAFLVLIVAQAYVADKILITQHNDKTYETRRYSFGFATLDDIRYTFKTYREYKYLPLEKKINEVDFFDTRSELDFRDGHLFINIKDSLDHQFIEISSSNGKKYTAEVK